MHPLYRHAVMNPDGEDIELRLDIGEGNVNVKGKFVYILKEEDADVCGVQFTEVSDEGHRRISRHVSEGLKDLVDSQHD